MAVSENPPPPPTTSTRKRLRPPPLADPDAEPNHNSKHHHLLSSSPIPGPNPNSMDYPSSPNPNPNSMDYPSSPNPNPNSMNSPSSPNPNPNSVDYPSSSNPNPNSMDSPSSPNPNPNPNPVNSPSSSNPNPNSMDSPSSPNPNPNSMDSPSSPNPSPNTTVSPSSPSPNPYSRPVPSHLPKSLAELESTLQATTPLENFSPCGDDDTLPDDLVIAEMMQSLERVITNKAEAVVATVTPSIESPEFHPSGEGITHTPPLKPNSSSSGSGKHFPLKEEEDENADDDVCVGMRCEELIDGEIPCTVDASDCGDGHMLDDLRHIIEASDDELGLIPAVVVKDSCSTEGELYEVVVVEGGGGVLDAAELELEEWDVPLTAADGEDACSSSSSPSSCSGGMDEEAVDYALCDDAQIGVWDFEPDDVMMNGMGEYVVDAYGGAAGFEGLMMMIREPNASAG